MSNQVLSFHAVCTDPSATDPDTYRLLNFERGNRDWAFELATLAKYDKSHLFSPLLDALFQPASVPGPAK
jgi:hypothetical protein